MKNLIFTIFLSSVFLSCFAQRSTGIVISVASPQNVQPYNLVMVDTTGTPGYNWLVVKKDTIRWFPYNIRWINDTILAVGNRAYPQLAGSYPNASFIPSLAASKVFGLSSVALTGAYTDLTGTPNLSLYYLASNPSGYINAAAVTIPFLNGVYGFQPLQPSDTVNKWYPKTGNPSGFLTSYTETDPLFDTKFAAKTTTGLAEGSNLYYTAGRFNAAFAAALTGAAINSALGYTAQAQINGTGFVKATGTMISYDNSTYLTGITGAQVNTALGYAPYNGATNPNNYLTSIPAQSFASLTGKPTTLAGYGITDATANARATISLTTTGTSGSATYTGGVINIPNYTQYVPAPHAVTRTVNSATFTPSSTLTSNLTYYIEISCTATIGSASAGTVILQTSTDGGSTWTTRGTIKNSNTVSLAVVLNSTSTQTVPLIANAVPAGALCRLVPTVAGTTVITYISGDETY